MKISKFFFTSALLFAASVAAAPICPTTSNNSTGADATGCGVLITDSPAGAVVTLTGTGAYDGSEDETVGLINSTGKALTTLSLSSTSGAFGFEGDGIQTYTSTNGVAIPSATGVTGYEGPNMTFNLAGVYPSGGGTLVVNFTTSLADGSSTYFSLEGAPSIGITVGASSPEPASVCTLLGGMLTLGGVVLRRRRKQ